MRTFPATVSRGWPRALLLLLLAACSDNPDQSEPNPKQACLDANQFQRDATALENAIRVATDADVPTLNNQAASLSHEMTAEVSSGKAAGTLINDDLTAAVNAVNRITTDLSTPNLAQAKIDVEVLRNAMVKLGMDCSPYIS
jgi:hypothetical protein